MTLSDRPSSNGRALRSLLALFVGIVALGLFAMNTPAMALTSGLRMVSLGVVSLGVERADYAQSIPLSSLRSETEAATPVASAEGIVADADELSEEGRRLRPVVVPPVRAFEASRVLLKADDRDGRLGPLLPDRPPRT